MNSALVSKPIMIDLNIGDQITSISCGHIVVEFVKFIAYQRQQIPYTYPWLKQVINKKKLSKNDDGKESYNSERHFRIASTALENLDLNIKSLLQEINGSSVPDEVCIALGATPVALKEVYRLLLPTTCHKPQCHSTLIATDQKIQRNIFKELVTAEKLSKVIFKPLPPTNMYIFLKKKTNPSYETVCCENFQHSSGCRIPRSSNIVVVDFRTQNLDGVACCKDIQIFSDAVSNSPQERTETDQDIKFHEMESTAVTTWYQSSYIMKGFKDTIVNGCSIVNTWLAS